MELLDIIRNSTQKLSIVGTTPLIPKLELSAQQLADLLTLNPELKINILYESDSELFSQSLLFSVAGSNGGASFERLKVHRDRISGTTQGGGLQAGITELLQRKPDNNFAKQRIAIWQTNLRLAYNVIQVDSKLFVAFTGCRLQSINDYREIDQANPFYSELELFLKTLIETPRGKEFLSDPRSEYIQLYDNDGLPRGVFPRLCFYTTEYQRHSVWGFVFNRNGKMLLHQRSKHTKDGRELWDKSIGGHVDLKDSSTFITAQRELIEELFLPEAEYTRYMKADLGDIINFGDWHPQKRIEESFQGAFGGLQSPDWIMFRATGRSGEPLTIVRKSERRIHRNDDTVVERPTRFISDAYLFIAPAEFIDTDQQMEDVFKRSQTSGAALNHKLVTVDELAKWIDESERNGASKATFTDDLLFINIEHRAMLERFAEFVKYSFHK